MSDDTIRTIEELLRSRRGVLDQILCLGCAKVVEGGVRYLRVEMINDRGIDTNTVISVCSWACLRDLAEEVAGGACPLARHHQRPGQTAGALYVPLLVGLS